MNSPFHNIAYQLVSLLFALTASLLVLVPVSELSYFSDASNRTVLYALPFTVYLLHRRTAPLLVQLGATRADGAAALVLVSVAFSIYTSPFPVIIGGQDPSLYFAKAITAIDHGMLDRPMKSWDSIISEDKPADWLIDVNGAYNKMFNGIVPIVKSEGSKLITDFTSAPVLLHTMMGMIKRDLVLYGSTLSSLLALSAFYCFLRTSYNWYESLVGSALLAFNTTQYWFGNATYSEVPAQAVCSLAFLFLFLSKGTHLGFLSLSVLAAIVSVSFRTENFLLVSLLILLIPRFQISARNGIALMLASTVAYLLYDHVLSNNYSLYYYRLSVESTVIGARVYIVLACTAISGAAYMAHRCNWSRCAQRIGSIPLGFFVGAAAVVFLVLLFIRPEISPFHEKLMHGRIMRSYRENTFHNLSLTISPLILFAAVVGYFVAIKSALQTENRILLSYLTVSGFFFSLYVYDPLNSPQMYWVLRRFIPFVIPLIIFFFLFGVTRIPQRPTRLLVLLAAVGFQFFLFFHSKPTTEMDGALASVKRFLSEYPDTEVIFTSLEYRHEVFAIAFWGNIDFIPIADGTSASEVSHFAVGMTSLHIGYDSEDPDFVFEYLRRGEDYDQLPTEVYHKRIPFSITQLH